VEAPSTADLELWKSLAAQNKAAWLTQPSATLMAKLPDGSDARLPIASVYGRYFLAALATGSPQPGEPLTGYVPIEGKAPEPIPTVQAGPLEAKRSNVALNSKATASSEEADKGNTADKAVDGKNTRWCPAKGLNGEWLAVDLGKTRPLTGYRVQWEGEEAIYRHQVEVSGDNKTWQLVSDVSQLEEAGSHAAKFNAEGRYVRITFSGQKGREQSYGSIREFEVLGVPEIQNAAALRPPLILE